VLKKIIETKTMMFDSKSVSVYFCGYALVVVIVLRHGVKGNNATIDAAIGKY
jgi:hypothetical protein